MEPVSETPDATIGFSVKFSIFYYESGNNREKVSSQLPGEFLATFLISLTSPPPANIVRRHH